MWQRALRKAILWAVVLPILGAAASATAQEAVEEPVERGWYQSWFNGWGEYVPRAGLGYEVGDGIGYSDGYGRVEGLIPLAEDPGQLLIFSDLRMLLDNDGHPGGNLGLGYRYYAAELDRTFGAVFYYDLRETDLKTFQQLTVSFDTLGSWFDFRTNVYVQSIFSDRGYQPTRFMGNYLWLSGEDRALSGLDMEAMVPLPMWRSFDPRLGVGGYHFQGVNVEDIWGWKVRLETRMDEKVTVDLAVSDDEQFGTTATLGVAMWLPNLWSQRPGLGAGRRPPVQRLGEPVKRLENIAVVSRSSEVAHDPATGAPWTFLHVAPESAASDGSFESPFGSLAAALDDPRYQSGAVDVVYVRSDPAAPLVHVGNVTFVAGTQLRSNGPVQWLTTQRGRVQLPFSGVVHDLAELSPILTYLYVGDGQLPPSETDSGLVGLPRISGCTTLASNTYLSGFDLLGSVVGVDVSNVTVAENRILMTSTRPTEVHPGVPSGWPFEVLPEFIGLTRAAGTVTIRDNIIKNPVFSTGHGISLVDTQEATVAIARNTIQDCTRGVLFSGGKASANIVGNTIVGNEAYFEDVVFLGAGREAPSIGIDLTSGSTFTGTIRDNVITGSGFGLHVASDNFTGTISGNQIRDHKYSGILLSSANFDGEICDNTLSDNGSYGISGDGGDRFHGTIAGNVIRDNAWSGIGIEFLGSSTARHLAVLDNEFSGNGPYAIDVAISQMSNTGDLYLELDGNVSHDCPTPGSCYFNYELTRISALYDYSYSAQYYAHLGENVGTIGAMNLGTLPERWNSWPTWPE